MIVRQLVTQSFAQAFIKYQDKHEEWVKISYRISGHSSIVSLILSIQNAGKLDLLIRCMEDEFCPDEAKKEPDFLFMFQVMLSELWIGHAYEILRLLKERKCALNHPDFLNLAHDLRLLRVAIEKHEIAGDKKLKQPLLMQRWPTRNDDVPINYSKEDTNRDYIMPTGISERGSVMWYPIDIEANKSYWIERLNLSERFLSLCEVLSP